MRIYYKCKCHHSKEDCKCDFLKRFERKLTKGLKSQVVNLYCDEDVFPGLDVITLVIKHLPNLNHLILKNVDFYDLPTIFQLLTHLPELKHLTMSSYKHSRYCFDDDVDLPIVQDLIIPSNLDSFNFVFMADTCDSHPRYTHNDVFIYPPNLVKLSLEHIAWPPLTLFNRLQYLTLTGLVYDAVQFPPTLLKLTINHINRWMVATYQDYNYKLPEKCRLILNFDASDKSCYSPSSEPESDPDLDEYKKRRYNGHQEEFDPVYTKNRLGLYILESFKNVDTCHLSSRLKFNIVPKIIKECTQLKTLSIAIKGRPKPSTWNSIKNHPSLKTLIVSISGKYFYQHLDNLIQVVQESSETISTKSSVKVYLVHTYSNPGLCDVKQYLKDTNVSIITGINSWKY